MVELGYLQGGGLWDWFIFHNPFIFTSFLLFFIASLASTKRAPFDLPESESELVAGLRRESESFVGSDAWSEHDGETGRV
jgi:NADH-quinone oxidoreductase subunit H